MYWRISKSWNKNKLTASGLKFIVFTFEWTFFYVSRLHKYICCIASDSEYPSHQPNSSLNAWNWLVILVPGLQSNNTYNHPIWQRENRDQFKDIWIIVLHIRIVFGILHTILIANHLSANCYWWRIIVLNVS